MSLTNPSFCAKSVPATNLRALQLHQAHSSAHQPEIPVIIVQSCLSEVEGGPIVKCKVSHLFR